MVKTRSDNSLTDSQKVQAIDTETIHKLLGIVVESEFFNSNKETGITSEEQKNANLYYFSPLTGSKISALLFLL